MGGNLDRFDTSVIRNIDEVPEENNKFEILKTHQSSFIAEELIQPKASRHRRYSSWICSCDVSITKERIKRQLNRGKTTVEEHVCYPWLRRLFFHLSNYFPNLHTSRPSRRYRPHTSMSTALNFRPANKNVSVCTYKSHTSSYKENDGKKVGKHSSIQRVNSMTKMSMSAFSSSDITNNSYENNNNNNNVSNTGFKRRPLQRQKSNGFTEFTEPEMNFKDRLTYSSSSETSNLRLRQARLTTTQTKSSVLPAQNYRLYMDCPHSNRLQGANAFLSKSSLSINETTRSNIITPIVYGYSSTKIKSHQNLQTIKDEQYMNKSSGIHLTDNMIRPINRRAHMIRSANLIYDTFDELSNDYTMNDQHKSLLSNSTRIYNDSNTHKNINHCDLPDSGLFCTLNDLPYDQEPVKKHLESWLKEAVTRTIQGKTLIRRSHMSHVSSGEAQREPPETVTPQPHSFDGPISRYRDEFTTSYGQRSMEKPFSMSLNISTESPQIKPPYITRDSIDGYSPYYYESMFEKQPEIINHNITDRTDERVNLSLSDQDKSYQRNSINPMSDVNNKNLKFIQKSSFTYDNNFTAIKTSSIDNNNQIPNDYTNHALPLIQNNDRLQITHVSRERANSFKESDKIKEEYRYRYNHSNVDNNKAVVYSTDNINNNILSYYVNATSRNTGRLSSTIKTNQRHSFSERLKLSRSPNVRSLPEKYRLTHTLSDENRNEIISATMSTTNTSQSIRRLLNFKKSPQTSIDLNNTSQHANEELYRRGSKYSNILDPSLSMDCSASHQPHHGMYGERRYSRHLKPLDAWQSRQSHSMEIVYSTPTNQYSSSSPQKRSPLSKQAAIRKLPAIYSRSLQHSTCSFPVQWGGFLSGPTLSLTSAFDSSSLTPDSLNHKQFFRSSLDSHEPVQLTAGQKQQQRQHSQNQYKHKFFISQDHAHSATESPRNLISLTETINDSRNIKSLQQSRINLSPWPYNTQLVTRKVHSSELNPNAQYQQLLPDFVRNTTVLLKVRDNLPKTHSTSSSRRGSAISNNSVFILKEMKSKLNNDMLSSYDLISNSTTNYTDNTVLHPSSVQNCKTKQLEKLIPPDLIFSPASRRASMMDDDISSVQPSMLNITSDLEEFYLNHTENNNNISVISNNPIDKHHQDITDSQNHTKKIQYNNNQSDKLMSTNLVEPNCLNSLPHQHFTLKYNRHKSADTYIPPDGLNNLQNLYFDRNNASVKPNTRYLSQTYFKPTQQSLTPPRSPLLLINNNNNSNNNNHKHEDGHLNCHYQSQIRVTCCSQIDMRSLQNGWNSMHQLVDNNYKYKMQHQINTNNSISKPSIGIYNSDYNLTNHFQEPLFLDEGHNCEDINCICKRRTSVNQTQSISDEEHTDDRSLPKSLIKSEMKNFKGKDYLFKSTRGSDTNIIDPQLLKPSLGPVIDSSDENTSDICDDDYNDDVGRIQTMNICITDTPLQSKTYHKNKKDSKAENVDSRQIKTDSHAARRKSFLANYWQQTIQQDDELSNEDIEVNINESDYEFNQTKIKSNRYESTSGLNHYRTKYHAENDSINGNDNIKDSSLLQINKSINTRSKSSESGLNYFNNPNSSNTNNAKLLNSRELPSSQQQHQDYSIKKKSRRKPKYH
ncbi:unnamed protein product [Schistosoma turkestanicum]|nr:unnamed protein product [Schistosoma turkestanicum]